MDQCSHHPDLPGVVRQDVSKGIAIKSTPYVPKLFMQTNVRDAAEVDMDKQARKDGVPDEVQMGFFGMADTGGQNQDTVKRAITDTKRTKPPFSLRLTQHELSKMLPSRSPEALRQLRAAMELFVESDHAPPVYVVTHDRHVLWDWDRYEIALDLGLRIQELPYWGNDPVAALCLKAMHQLHIDAGRCALTVVVMCEWAVRGRPRKSTLSVSFPDKPRTIREMADLAGTGSTRVSQAKSLHGCGLAERVLDGLMTFGTAIKRLQLVREAGFEEDVIQGRRPFDEAYEEASSRVAPDPVAEHQPADAGGQEQQEQDVRSLDPHVANLERDKELLQERIRKLTNEHARVVHELKFANEALEEALEVERVLREAAEEAVQQMKLRLEVVGIEV